MKRAIILVMDSFGIGASADADKFGDVGADTFGHIAKACFEGKADGSGRSGVLSLPNLSSLGLTKAAFGSTGHYPAGFKEVTDASLIGSYGYAEQVSSGKDTPSGHWEIAGLPVTFDWGYFPKTIPCFPDNLIKDFIEQANLPGILGNCHASGTEIIKDLGDEHIKTLKPICYTSADSVFQIAAHEEHFGLDRLEEISEIAQKLTLPLNIGRIISRPFIGHNSETYQRTANRHDYTMTPHGKTLLDHVIESGSDVFSIGKITDIFANQGVSHSLKASGNMALFDSMLSAVKIAKEGDLIFANFIDFDSQFGHRRDITGYAAALEAFDQRLPELLSIMSEDDLLLITADHGCDPSWPGNDHTREHVPVLFYSKNKMPRSLGLRHTFADMGQTIASHLKLHPLKTGIDCDLA